MLLDEELLLELGGLDELDDGLDDDGLDDDGLDGLDDDELDGEELLKQQHGMPLLESGSRINYPRQARSSQAEALRKWCSCPGSCRPAHCTRLRLGLRRPSYPIARYNKRRCHLGWTA